MRIMASALVQCRLFGSSYDLVMEGWAPKENNDGVVYFVNNQRQLTSWTHPYISKVFEEIGEYNNVKYAAYRTALKLRFLQVKFGLYLVSIKSVRKIFPFSSDCDNGGSSEDTMSCREIFDAVYQIMELSDSFRLYRDKLAQASEIILNLILELFDTSRTGKVTKRSVRLALVVLSSAKLSDKYRFFFEEISNDQGHIQRGKFLYLIYDLMQITELIKESTAFGTNVSAAVNSCLKSSITNNSANDQSGNGNQSHHQNSQDDFFSWLLQEPVCIVWLPTLHRIVATEAIRHDVQCCVCNIRPMVGFRYRCMQCFSYDLCQSCFFEGLFSHGHRLKHPMQEYCFPTTRKDNTKALLKIVRNKMSKRHRRTKIKQLPIDDDSLTGSVFQWQPRSLIPNPRGSFYSSTDSGLAGVSSDQDADCPGVRDQAFDEDNLAMMKRWCKPVEVLGEPCNTSSPCVQESMSKKNMDSQQFKMAQTIQQLQEENRVLRQKLSAARKRELEQGEEEESGSESVHHVPMAVVHEAHQSGDPLKEITTDAPISPINPMTQSDRSTGNTPGTSFLVDRDFKMAKVEGDDSKDICVNVLEIVGTCTPIQSTFCMENNVEGSKRKRGSVSGSNGESGISEGAAGQDSSSTESSWNNMEERLSQGGSEGDRGDIDALRLEQNGGLLSQSMKNGVVDNCQMYGTDTETESTTCNDLEYTYSDMSLKSETASSRTSGSSKMRGTITFEPEEPPMGVEKEQEAMMEGSHAVDETYTRKVASAVFGGMSHAVPNDYGDDTSDFMTPDLTRNETSVELDAFKLIRMKFKTPEKDKGSCRTVEGDMFDISNTQPRLIYSSSNLQQQNKTEMDDEFQDFSCESFHASRIQIDASHEENKNTPCQPPFHSSKNSFYPSFDLSVIPAQESSSFSFMPKSASCLPSQPTTAMAASNPRRKTLEPVYMSTPVADNLIPGVSYGKPAGKKKSTLAKKVLLKQQREKENQSPFCSHGSGRSQSSGSVCSSVDSLSVSRAPRHYPRKDLTSFGSTPKSSIPPGQRHRILVSINGFQQSSNRSYSCNDLTLDREVGMTTLFDRAEHQRTIGAGSQSLPAEDKEELERLIDQVRIGESGCSDASSSSSSTRGEGVGDSSILRAVLHVGDAMADFVQATADVHRMRDREMESTYL